MNTIGGKLAIRKALFNEYPLPSNPKPYFDNAIAMMQSIRSKNRFCADSFRMFRRNPRLFSLDDFESKFLASLLNQGYAVAPSFFSKAIIDRIYAKADKIFSDEKFKRENEESSAPASPPENVIRTIQGVRERTTELVEPLASIPDVLDIAFHETLLKIAAHFFLHIPRLYRVSLVRHYPHHRPKCLAGGQSESDCITSLNFLINLVDNDDTCGPFVFVPGIYNCLTGDSRERTETDSHFAGQTPPPNDEPLSPRSKWMMLRGERGSVVALPGSGKRGSVWSYPADVTNRPRTSIMIHISGYRVGAKPVLGQNRMLKWNFDRMTGLQQMFAHPALVDQPLPRLAKAG